MDEIKRKVNAAISKLYENDNYLLRYDVNERSITHKLGAYLQIEFKDFDVDCEYNKNIDEPNGLKNIYFLKELAERLKIKNNKDQIFEDEIYSVVSIYPDIIVHKRGENKKNLLIMEVKKTTNSTSRELDFSKLEHYTNNSLRSLNYQYGLFLEIETNVLDPKSHLSWYKNGILIPT